MDSPEEESHRNILGASSGASSPSPGERGHAEDTTETEATAEKAVEKSPDSGVLLWAQALEENEAAEKAARQKKLKEIHGDPDELEAETRGRSESALPPTLRTRQEEGEPPMGGTDTAVVGHADTAVGRASDDTHTQSSVAVELTPKPSKPVASKSATKQGRKSQSTSVRKMAREVDIEAPKMDVEAPLLKTPTEGGAQASPAQQGYGAVDALRASITEVGDAVAGRSFSLPVEITLLAAVPFVVLCGGFIAAAISANNLDTTSHKARREEFYATLCNWFVIGLGLTYALTDYFFPTLHTYVLGDAWAASAYATQGAMLNLGLVIGSLSAHIAGQGFEGKWALGFGFGIALILSCILRVWHVTMQEEPLDSRSTRFRACCSLIMPILIRLVAGMALAGGLVVACGHDFSKS